jgi:serine/threonine-protein kinase
MGEAYLALSGDLAGLRTPVVVKRILPHLSSKQRFVGMFYDEARISALLDHPNIARIIEVGRDVDGYFLVMEAVRGQTLAKVLLESRRHERPLAHAVAAFIVAQAASGLAHAHNLTSTTGRPLNVVHRDVSPENILVSFEGAVKVIDFGIATAIGRITETRPGGRKGRLAYMAPEQVLGGVVDRRADIFALGVVLWEAVCGRRLFHRPTDLAMVRANVEEPILRPSTRVAISPRLERIIMRALERLPENRFQDAQEMSVHLLRHAFASDGFHPRHVGEHMSGLFESHHAAWREALRGAADAGWTRPRRITRRFPPAVDTEVDDSGATVPLFRIPAPSTPSDVSSDEISAEWEAIPGSVEGHRRARRAPKWLARCVVLASLLGGGDRTFRELAPAPTTSGMVLPGGAGTGGCQPTVRGVLEKLPVASVGPESAFVAAVCR